MAADPSKLNQHDQSKDSKSSRKRPLSPLSEEPGSDVSDAKFHRERSPPYQLVTVSTTARASTDSVRSTSNPWPCNVSMASITSSSSDQGPCSAEGKTKFTRQSSINSAIRERVSDWRTYNINSDTDSEGRSSSTNIFDVLPLDTDHLPYDEFHEKLTSLLCPARCPASSKVQHYYTYIEQADDVLRALQQNGMMFSIPSAARKVHGVTKTYSLYPDLAKECMTRKQGDENMKMPAKIDGLSKDLKFWIVKMKEYIVKCFNSRHEKGNFGDIMNYQVFPETDV